MNGSTPWWLVTVGKYISVDYANKTAFIRNVWWLPGLFLFEVNTSTGRGAELFAALPRIQRVVDVTDHESGENPYYT